MTNPTTRSRLRSRLLRPSAILMTLLTAGWLVGLFASSAEAKGGGNLTSAHAIAKHITPVKGGAKGGSHGGGKGGVVAAIRPPTTGSTTTVDRCS